MPEPTPEQLYAIPLGGTDNAADRRMRGPEKLVTARNVYAPEIGTLAKRHGFSKVTASNVEGGGLINTHGPIRGLGRTSKEVLAVGARELWAYPTSTGISDYWYKRGELSPYTGHINERFRGVADYRAADCCRSGSILFYCAERWEDRGTTSGVNDVSAIAVTATSADGDTVLPHTNLLGSTHGGAGSNYPYTPLCAPTGEGVVMVCGYDDAAAPGELRLYAYDTTTPATAPVAQATLTNDLYYRSDLAVYDILGAANGDYIVAWIDNTAMDCHLARYNSAHVLQSSSTIVGDWYAVSLEEDTTRSTIYVLLAELNGAGLDNIKLYSRTSALVADWGPTTVSTVTAAYALGVAVGTDDTMARRIFCSWGDYDAGTWASNTVTRSTDTAGAGLDTGVTTFNCTPISRPYWQSNRVYLAVATNSPSESDSVGFEAALMLDGEVNETGRDPHLAGMWGVGTTLTARGGAPSLGTGGHVAIDSDGATCRLMSPFIAEAVKAETFGGKSALQLRYAFDEVVCSFGASVMVAPIYRGCAVIGGGFVAWYDGATCFELGFARPPMPAPFTLVGGGALNGTYDWSAMWVHNDAAGMLHRSVPSPARQAAPANQDVRLAAYTLPGSARARQDMTCQWYRAGSDAIPYRATFGTTVIGNAQAATTINFDDSRVDADLYVPRYTVGGALEAVAPEGASIVATARERVLLGGFYRGDRIQFSKLITPSAAGETAIAPEFYEALGRFSADGERVTGIAAMDQGTVVFTRTAVYAMVGDGPDATGAGDSMSRLVPISTDSGCIEPRSVIVYPDGVLFQSQRGIYRVDRGHAITAIGEPVLDLLDTYPVVTGAELVSHDRQVRFTVRNDAATDGRILVYDYRTGAWFEWQVKDSTGTTIVFEGCTYVDATFYAAESNGMLWKEDSATWYDNNTQWVESVIETAEVQPDGPMHWYAFGEVALTGERLDPHGLTVEVFNDYASTADATVTWTDAQLQALPNATDREQLHWLPPYPRAQSRRVRITDSEDAASVTGRGAEWHAIVMRVQSHQGIARAPGQGRQ